jgi:pimeloyl-ACP methyl ester carboxylesterase
VDAVRVVLLHGLPMNGRMWDHQLAWLPASSVAPTLYPLGRSIEDWAAGVLEQVGDEQLVVVGASVGGFCALEMARRRPDQVEAIVLVGCKAGVRRDHRARDRVLELVRRQELDGGWTRLLGPLFGPNATPALIQQARSVAAQTPPGLLMNGIEAFYDRPDLSVFARSWPKTLVLVSGEHDRTPSPATAAAVAAQAVDGRFHVVADSGHYVSLEQPEAFDAILRAVLAGATGSTSRWPYARLPT